MCVAAPLEKRQIVLRVGSPGIEAQRVPESRSRSFRPGHTARGTQTAPDIGIIRAQLAPSGKGRGGLLEASETPEDLSERELVCGLFWVQVCRLGQCLLRLAIAPVLQKRFAHEELIVRVCGCESDGTLKRTHGLSLIEFIASGTECGIAVSRVFGPRAGEARLQVDRQDGRGQEKAPLGPLRFLIVRPAYGGTCCSRRSPCAHVARGGDPARGALDPGGLLRAVVL
jgi:hypothetical protein